jgi:hypothetical protein
VRTAGIDEDYAGAREEDLVRILDELDAREERLRTQIAEHNIYRWAGHLISETCRLAESTQ